VRKDESRALSRKADLYGSPSVVAVRALYDPPLTSAMIQRASSNGWLDGGGRDDMMEALRRRAGAHGSSQRGRWLIVVAVGLALVWLLAFKVPPLVYPSLRSHQLDELGLKGKERLDARNDRLKLQNDLRTTILQGLGGLAVLGGAYFAARQLQIGREQLRVAQEGQVTERFTRAIDQLGSTELDVRLGGIYALERIARDSPSDRPTIEEVLTAYLRSHSPWPPRLPGQYTADAPIDEVPELELRAPDVQAAATVLGRRLLPPTGLRSLNLADVDLRKAYLPKANLEGARLSRTNLHGAWLRKANLQAAGLEDVNLKGTELTHTGLQRAWLHRADLRDARLDGASLQDARLMAANLQGVSLGPPAVNLQRAIVDARTVWPEHFDWQAAGVAAVSRPAGVELTPGAEFGAADMRQDYG
jgi:Pentapeptide repeats (8 copies)